MADQCGPSGTLPAVTSAPMLSPGAAISAARLPRPGSCGRVGVSPAGPGSRSGSAPPACQVVGGAMRVPFGRNVAKVPSARRTTVTWAA